MLGISGTLSYIVFVYLCICICVFVYLTVQNIIFDVLGPLAFQKYSIIRVFKVFLAWWQPNEQPGEPRASLLVEQYEKQTFAKCSLQILVVWRIKAEEKPLFCKNLSPPSKRWCLLDSPYLFSRVADYVYDVGHALMKRPLIAEPGPTMPPWCLDVWKSFLPVAQNSITVTAKITKLHL